MLPAWQSLLEHARPVVDAFAGWIEAPEAAQREFLRRMLVANAGTTFGRSNHFDRLTSAEAFAATVPQATYADLEDGLAAWERGEASLCAAPIAHREWTSGSGRAAKRIPYSADGLADFRNALFPWLANVCDQRPAIAEGRAYWAISPAGTPAFAERGESGGDAVYFGPAAQSLGALAAVPPAVGRIAEVERWRSETARHLAQARDLTLLSVWSPSFLLPLLDAIGGRDLDTRSLWPCLTLISCWTEGASARALPALAARFPGVEIQGKGVLSTEAAVSVPIIGAPAPVAALGSAFLELRGDDGTCRPVWRWREGDAGTMVVTTRSGLWRYDTGDRVAVVGHWRSAPCLRFLGRQGGTVDLCGEKLDENLVLPRLPEGVDCFLAPASDGRGYLLFVEVGMGDPAALAARTEARLNEILHYAHARQLGQLRPVEAMAVHGLLEAAVHRSREERGAALSSAKPPVLDGDSGWAVYFAKLKRVAAIQ